MQVEDFLIFLAHFVKHTRCSRDHRVLLLLDNHSSHLSVAAIDYTKENGTIMITFPPHCSHRLQPLDRSVYGPFKHYYDSEADTWMVNYPAKVMTIYDIAEIVGKALPKAITPSNITAGFRATGVVPFNRKIYTEADFAAAAVTDRADPTLTAPTTSCSSDSTSGIVLTTVATSSSTFTLLYQLLQSLLISVLL